MWCNPLLECAISNFKINDYHFNLEVRNFSVIVPSSHILSPLFEGRNKGGKRHTICDKNCKFIVPISWTVLSKSHKIFHIIKRSNF